MEAFLPCADPRSDSAYIRINGMWYQEWQGGYHDILKRGYPRPKNRTTVLAELHSPMTPDFLHGGADNVPFLVSAKVRAIVRKYGLSGVGFSSVEIAKIATKGDRKNQPEHVSPPSLFAARIGGRVEVIPDHPTGRCPRIGWVTPFDLPEDGEMPDLWRPTNRGRTFAAWVYCSPRFRDIVREQGFSNIVFEPFGPHMARYRRDVAARLAGVAEPGAGLAAM